MLWWLGWAVGCVEYPPDDLRAAWLADALVDDNRVWLSRDPALLATKYREMSEDPYDFLRGTTTVFYRDLERAGSTRAPTGFLTRPDAAQVLIVGDPHPENVGSLLPGDGPGPIEGDPELLLEVNDFDAAGFGPYLLDVRRALLGLAVLLHGAGCDEDCRESVLESEAEGWFDEITGSDEPFDPILRPDDDRVLDLLLDDVIEEGLERDLLADSTIATDRGPRFRLAKTLDDDGDGILGLTRAERAQAIRLVGRYPWPAGYRIHDLARRYGVGIASLPAIRYVVLWDRGDDGPVDDELLQLREVVDPPVLPTVPSRSSTLFDGNDERSVVAARTLWSRPDADARAASVADGPMVFKVQTWSSFDGSQSHTAIQQAIRDEELDEDDLRGWARHLGRQLAAVHGRSVTAGLEPAAEVIVADLDGREDDFVDERMDEVERDLTRLLDDHRAFHAALDELGPLLGATGIGP